MAQPSPAVIRASQAATRRMADRNTPFIFDEWYVAAFADELGSALLKRTLLGKRVILFRSASGAPVAMDDRCAHRSYPLSEGKLENDHVVCAYHGFRYDTKGNCVEVPSVAQCPKNIGVRAYRVVERGPLVWIWMGNEAKADETKIPDMEWTKNWACAPGYFHLNASYVQLHENLLDTSHLGFIHANTIGTPDYVKAPTTTDNGEGTFALVRTVSPTRLPPAWGKPTKLEGVPTASRIVRNEFHSPAFYSATTRLYDGALPEGERPEFLFKVAHLLTPETAGTCHYFIYLGRDFGKDDDSITAFMKKAFFAAFEEDVVSLEKLDVILREADPETYYELSVATDALGIAMRRYLKDRSDAEHGVERSTRSLPQVTEEANSTS